MLAFNMINHIYIHRINSLMKENEILLKDRIKKETNFRELNNNNKRIKKHRA